MVRDRRYDIDWIRVIVFDILIIYHVGMFFVPWGYHLKNNEVVEWMIWPMLFINQWRLPILFVISGIGTRFALSSKTSSQYIKERTSRLLIPLIFGVLLIVPPQVYLERLSQGQQFGSYLNFYPYFFEGIYPNGNFSWHHLWFLPYLFLISVVVTPLLLWLRKENNKGILFLRMIVKKYPFSLFLFALPMMIVEIFLEPIFPITYALIDDWYVIPLYSILFLSGFILISIGECFWISINKIKRYSLITGIITFLVLLWAWYVAESSIILSLVKTLNMWCWVLSIFAYAALFLNKRSNTINYRNQAVYPFYILHQTIMLLIGFWLMNFSIHYFWKFSMMIIVTFITTWFFYELIKRIPILRPLFGIKRVSGEFRL